MLFDGGLEVQPHNTSSFSVMGWGGRNLLLFRYSCRFQVFFGINSFLRTAVLFAVITILQDGVIVKHFFKDFFLSSRKSWEICQMNKNKNIPAKIRIHSPDYGTIKREDEGKCRRKPVIKITQPNTRLGVHKTAKKCEKAVDK
ncbi:MAG: hypothetical protein LUG58_07440 [Clostridiales bacterium]|nr:hypothetical protein [Clostridiales bacterium]